MLLNLLKNKVFQVKSNLKIFVLILKKGKMSLDVDMCIEQLKKCELLKENEVKILCAKAKEVLIEEGNVQRVEAPVTVLFISLIFVTKIKKF